MPPEALYRLSFFAVVTCHTIIYLPPFDVSPINAEYPDIRRVSTTFLRKKKYLFLTLGNIPEGISPKEYSRRNIRVSIPNVLQRRYAVREWNQMKGGIMGDTEARRVFLRLEMCFVSIWSCRR
nr:MAG TPA: hypothetical protein [Caudoviricetes sp.]